METPLRILLVEDNELDAVLIERELKKSKIDCLITRVEEKKSFLRALNEFNPTIIISDYHQPQFSALEALQLMKQKQCDLPFIVLTGTGSEELAVEILKEGADDYVLKKHLKHIPSAIHSVMEKKELQQTKNHAEKKEKEANEHIKNILESMNDAFVALDTNWCYTYMNKRAGEIFGRNPEEMRGKHIWTEFPEGIGQPFYHNYYKAVAEQQFIQMEEYYQPYDKWFENRIYPSPDGLSIFFQDITEKKKQELALIESKQQLQLALDASNTGLWDWNLKTNDVYFSPEWKRQLGYSIDELPNEFATWENLLHPDDREKAKQKTMAFVQHHSGDFENEFRLRHKDGTYRWIYTRAKLFLDDEGKPERMLGSHVDISERKRNEQLLVIESQLFTMISARIPLPEVLEKLVLNIETILKDTIASVLLLDDDGLHVHYGAAPNLPEAYNTALEGAEIGPSAGSCGTAAFRKELVIVSDIETDSRWENYRELARPFGFRACWSNPILNSEGTVLGTFAMYYREPRNPKEEDIKFIERTTQLACIAIEQSRKELALKEEHELNQKIMETSPVGIISVNSDGQITYANLKAENILRLTRNELAQRTYNAPEWKITDFEGNPFPNEQLPFSLVMKTGKSATDIRHAIELPDGERVYLSINASPLYDVQGNVDGMVASIEDITERKRTEEQIRLLAHSMEQMNEIVVMTDLNDNITFVNKAFTKQFGYTFEEIHNKHVSMLVSEKTSKSEHNYILEQNRKEMWSGELWNKTKDGREILIYLRTSRIYDANGNVIALVGISEDITARKRAEEELRASEEKFFILFQKSPLSTALSRIEDGVLVDVNKTFERLFGFTRQEAIGKTSLELGINPDAEKRALILSQIQAQGAAHDIELNLQTKAGEERAFLLNIDRVEIGGQGFILQKAQDITERKRAEELLQQKKDQLEQLTEQLLSTQEIERKRISHELHDEMGQSLTMLKINLESLKNELSQNASLSTKQKLVSLTSMSENLLDQIHEMTLELHPSMLDDLGLLPTLLWHLDRFGKQTAITPHIVTKNFETQLPAKIEIALYRIIQEATTNIAKHAKAKNVTVTLSKMESSLDVVIEDDGKGFSLSKIEHRKPEHFGIGIIGMRERVSILNGTMHIETAPGKGTKIIIALPMEEKK